MALLGSSRHSESGSICRATPIFQTIFILFTPFSPCSQISMHPCTHYNRYNHHKTKSFHSLGNPKTIHLVKTARSCSCSHSRSRSRRRHSRHSRHPQPLAHHSLESLNDHSKSTSPTSVNATLDMRHNTWLSLPNPICHLSIQGADLPDVPIDIGSSHPLVLVPQFRSSTIRSIGQSSKMPSRPFSVGRVATTPHAATCTRHHPTHCAHLPLGPLIPCTQ